MSLWSVEELKYFRRAKKNWKEVYGDNEKKQMMYGEFKNWLNMYGKNITVGKSNKTLHLVLARWTLKDDDKLRGRQWSSNALEARRKRRKDIFQIGVTIY
jgi:hypothetical protein